jgi:daunorubicin/doxorubicin transport system permease protein
MSTGTVVLFPLTLASYVFIAPQTMPGWLRAFVRVNRSATWSPPSAAC